MRPGTEKSEIKAAKVIGYIAFVLVGIPYAWWAYAVALLRIWNWYIPPFLPAMTFKVALGMSFVVDALFVSRIRSKNKDKDGDVLTEVITIAIMPWIVLGAARVGLWMFFE